MADLTKTYLQVVSTIASKEKVEAEVCIKVQRLFLKVIGGNQKMDFYYSFDGEKYNILDRGIDSRFLSTEKAGGFVGCTFGMYASSNGKESNNYADFLYLNYSRI